MVDYTKATSGGDQPPTKVLLTKAASSVSLTKAGATSGVMRVNLNWTARPPGSGGGLVSRLLSGGGGAIDLDLGCLWEYRDGRKSVIQALGHQFDDGHVNPIIRLDGDDRSGANAGGENLFIDLSRAEEIRRVLVFAYIYEGTPNWAAANAVVTLHPQAGPQVEMRMDEHGSTRVVALFMLSNNGGQDLVVQREMRPVRGSQSDLDRAYGWGLRWSRGTK